jgi:uncharacterized Zn-finger protein
MAESAQISVSSTNNTNNDLLQSTLQNNNLSPNQNSSPKINSNQSIQKRRFKNLVECYPCTVDDCQILFETQKELDEHKATHEKIYKCDFQKCEKSFAKLANLRKHYNAHYKNKKIFHCPYQGCNKSFSASYSLTSHYRIHTGNMPFKCEICGKKFFDKANWQYHSNNIHKKIIRNKLTCQHKNCEHISKSVKQLLMHHDKLEEQCVKEKNLLLKLIMFYQSASAYLLESSNNPKIDKDFVNFEDNLGVDDEYKTIWINYINNYKLDEDLEKEVSLIRNQIKNVIDSSKNKDKYKGILDNY